MDREPRGGPGSQQSSQKELWREVPGGTWREAAANGAGPRGTGESHTLCTPRARVPPRSAALPFCGAPPQRGQVNVWVCSPGA